MTSTWSGVTGEIGFDALDDPGEHWGREGMKQVEETGTFGKRKVGGVLTEDADRTSSPSRGFPLNQVFFGRLCQAAVQFYAYHLAKTKLRCHQNGPALAASEVDKAVVGDCGVAVIGDSHRSITGRKRDGAIP